MTRIELINQLEFMEKRKLRCEDIIKELKKGDGNLEENNRLRVELDYKTKDQSKHKHQKISIEKEIVLDMLRATVHQCIGEIGLLFDVLYNPNKPKIDGGEFF